MGASTDAILFYGYVWDDEGDLFPGEWEEIVALKRGHKNPWDDYPSGESHEMQEKWVRDHSADLDAWRAIEKAIGEELGVGVDDHGADAWRCPYLFISDSRIEAYRGSPKEIPMATLGGRGTHTWDDKLQRFIDELDIDISKAKGPRWWLVSWWG